MTNYTSVSRVLPSFVLRSIAALKLLASDTLRVTCLVVDEHHEGPNGFSIINSSTTRVLHRERQSIVLDFCQVDTHSDPQDVLTGTVRTKLLRVCSLSAAPHGWTLKTSPDPATPR